MEDDLSTIIFEKVKDSLEKVGLYSGESGDINYNPNINLIDDRFLKPLILDFGFQLIKKYFRNFYSKHRKDIKKPQTLTSVRKLLSAHNCWPKQLITELAPTIESLEEEELLDRNSFALTMMENVYNERVERDELRYYSTKRKAEEAFYRSYSSQYPHDFPMYSEEYRIAEEKFIDDWYYENFGTNNPKDRQKNNFYNIELNEHSFPFIIVNTMLKEYNVDIDSEIIKKMFNKNKHQLQSKSTNLSPLQTREKVLTSLESEAIEYDKELQDIQIKEGQDIGEE